MRRGLSQGGRWLFKKGIWEGKKLAEVPPSGSSAPLFSRSDAKPPPSQSCRSLTSDVSKIPNAPVGLQATHPPTHTTGKIKILGTGLATCHRRPPKARGPGRGSRHPADTVHPSPPPRRAASQDSNDPGGV